MVEIKQYHHAVHSHQKVQFSYSDTAY